MMTMMMMMMMTMMIKIIIIIMMMMMMMMILMRIRSVAESVCVGLCENTEQSIINRHLGPVI